MALLSLLTTPSSYRKLQSEVDDFFSSESSPASHIIPFSAAKTNLPYTQAVLREALRLWPPSAGLFSKQVPEQGDYLHGYYLPKGTEVGQSMMGIGRQERIFGGDAEIFRPERWIEASSDAERFEEMQAAVELVFSTGKYVCLGKQIAWMELVKWFVEVSWCHDYV
jgi:cytochrome P450